MLQGIFLISVLVSNFQETAGVFSPNVTVRSCTSHRIVIRLENASDGGLIYIQGRSSTCKRTTSSQVKYYEFEFDLCSIKYDSKFRVIVQTGYDKVIPVMCLIDTADLKVSNLIYPECSVDEELFPNFEHKSQGDISTTFRAFQPTNLHGEPEIDVSFTCNVAVCKGECHRAVCGEVLGRGRKKRESDTDEIIENVTCGTTLKVRTPLIEAQAQDDEQTGHCMDRYIVMALAAVTAVTLLLSWIMCGRIYCQLKKLGKEQPQKERRKSLTEQSINVERAVGRRFSTMFQLPTGYTFGITPEMDNVPECEETPPSKRRESVHVSTKPDDVIPRVCRLGTEYEYQDSCAQTNVEDFKYCFGNQTGCIDKSPDFRVGTVVNATDKVRATQIENSLQLDESRQSDHIGSNHHTTSFDGVRKCRGSSSDHVHIFRSTCGSERSLISTSSVGKESVGSMAGTGTVCDDVVNDEVFVPDI